MNLPRQVGWELRRMFARRRTWIGFGAFLVLQAMVLILLQTPRARRSFARLLERGGYGFEDYYAGLTLALVVVSLSFFLLGGLYLALVGGDVVAKEEEEGTLRLVLARPVSRVRVAGVKAAACAAYNLLLVVFLGASSLAVCTLRFGRLGGLFVLIPEEGLFVAYDPGPGLARYVIGIGLMAVSTQVITAIAFMFSCFRIKPAAATVLTLSVLFLDMVLRNVPYFADYRPWFITHHTAAWIRSFQEAPAWWDIGRSLVMVAAVSLTCVAIGAARFSTRDFKS